MSPTAVLYVAQAIHGLAYGMLLFLVASGLTMIFGMMGILNIAHASFAMLSAYFCYQVLVNDRKFLGGAADCPGGRRSLWASDGAFSLENRT